VRASPSSSCVGALSPALRAGKYIGNRPVKLRKSRWQDREAD